MFTIPENTKITPKLAVKFIRKHIIENEKYDKLYSYYIGEHDILSRSKDRSGANNRLVCNHAKYITDCATGYFLGSPVKYESRSGKDLTLLKNVLADADSETQDIDLARFGSIYGVSYEMLYLTDSGSIKLASLNPRSAFVVYDDTVKQEPVFGVYYMPLADDGTRSGYRVYLCDKDTVREFITTPGFTVTKTSQPYEHYFGGVPMIEYYNNWNRQGDFEQVVSLIDAYNTLQSDRINDKEQFVNALLIIKGQILGDTAEEESETFRAIKKYGIMTMDDTGDAKWLTRQFDEASVDILRRSIENDIHKFSGVPCLTDESFSGNSSGVAMKYKLLAFEQITKIKERYFAEGLKIRLALIANALSVRGYAKPDVKDINITFKHYLPENEAETAQIVSLLNGIVEPEKLVKLLPYELD